MKTEMMIGVALITLLSGLAQAQPVDNAALLYYQAFLVYEKPDDEMSRLIADYRKGDIEGNERIGEHLEQNRIAIDLAVKAGEMDTCNWGYDYTRGFDLQMPNLSQLRRIAFLLSADAKWQAEHGDHATASDRCITLRKMALHSGDRTLVCYLVGTALNSLANRAIQNVLSAMPSDVKELSDLKDRLNQTQERFPTLEHALAQEAEICAVSMYKEKSRGIIEMMEQDESSMVQRLREGDEAFFKRNRDYYADAIKKLIDTLGSNLPYDRMCAKLDELTGQPDKEAASNPDATLAAMSLPAVQRIFQLKVRQETHDNAINVAIDLYIAKAKTGRLPDALPAGTPVDLFSGKPFAYVKTAKGFTLRCQAKEVPDKDPCQYEFTVRN